MQLLYFIASTVSHYKVSCIVAAHVGVKSKNLHFLYACHVKFLCFCKHLFASLRVTILFFFCNYEIPLGMLLSL